MPEYLKKRFGGTRLRVYNACIQLALSVLTGISVGNHGNSGNVVMISSSQKLISNYAVTMYRVSINQGFV